MAIDISLFTKLEAIPNIGPAIAADLRVLGITTPALLLQQSPLSVYDSLAEVMGVRHDPCVLYTLLAAKNFLETGEALKWWHFTQMGKKLLADQK